ncbi:MAG: hypothetical protein ABGX07_22690, partial [Pirellulaceae bacterium]
GLKDDHIRGLCIPFTLRRKYRKSSSNRRGQIDGQSPEGATDRLLWRGRTQLALCLLFDSFETSLPFAAGDLGIERLRIRAMTPVFAELSLIPENLGVGRLSAERCRMGPIRQFEPRFAPQ